MLSSKETQQYCVKSPVESNPNEQTVSLGGKSPSKSTNLMAEISQWVTFLGGATWQASWYRPEKRGTPCLSSSSCSRIGGASSGDTIRLVRENVHYCKDCFNLAEEDRCTICRDPKHNGGATLYCRTASRDTVHWNKQVSTEAYIMFYSGRLAPLDRDRPRAIDD